MILFQKLDHSAVSSVRKSRSVRRWKTTYWLYILLLSSDVLSSMPELGTACILFCTLPVTVATAERSFSKLKLIKSYLRSSIAQDRLDSLALISIENDAARKLNLDELVDRFAQSKARKKEFWEMCLPRFHGLHFFPSSTVVHFQTYRFILFFMRL